MYLELQRGSDKVLGPEEIKLLQQMSNVYESVQAMQSDSDPDKLLYYQCLKFRYKLFRNIMSQDPAVCLEISNITSPLFDRKYLKLTKA